MSKRIISAAQIDLQLATIDQDIANLTADVERLALSSLSGDEAATAELRAAQETMRIRQADRMVWAGARAEALRIVAINNEAYEAERQAELMADAAADITKMRAHASRIDEMVAEFAGIHSSLALLEGAIHASLTRAGKSPGGRTGQAGIASIARFYFESLGLAPYERPTGSFASSVDAAWGQYLPNDGDTK